MTGGGSGIRGILLRDLLTSNKHLQDVSVIPLRIKYNSISIIPEQQLAKLLVNDVCECSHSSHFQMEMRHSQDISCHY